MVLVLVLLLDQWTKHLILTRLRPGDLIPMGIFDIHHVHNTGAAFGIMPTSSHFFIVIALVVLGGMALCYDRIRRSEPWTLVSLALIAGGTLGNLVDRLRLGYVVDFIDFRWWPVFNVADSAICVGVTILAVRMMWVHDKPVQAPPPEPVVEPESPMLITAPTSTEPLGEGST